MSVRRLAVVAAVTMAAVMATAVSLPAAVRHTFYLYTVCKLVFSFYKCCFVSVSVRPWLQWADGAQHCVPLHTVIGVQHCAAHRGEVVASSSLSCVCPGALQDPTWLLAVDCMQSACDCWCVGPQLRRRLLCMLGAHTNQRRD